MANISMDKKYKIGYGEEVRILCIDAPGDLPVAGMVIGEHGPCLLLWPANGKFDVPSNGYYDLVEVTSYEGFYKWQPVMVRQSEHAPEHRRYFSHVEDGIAYCFSGGKDRWTSWDGSPASRTGWDHCRALTAEEQAEYDALMSIDTAP